ncbi:PKD domain-containing protein [Sunxiuqinia elliptica]|uniref:PKD domain-containing protein n=1 Tax=Sunxiuqinia elliptica TaxID=655355 RepID=A0A1I2HUE6_9BACT|nr:PKD domain-containing protein [Sunxiuqinia elliptica]SFF32336.1 PKD domain-containing protein [Sunxiuqinia elliptica]
MKKLFLFLFFFSTIGFLFLSSCKEDESRPTFPVSADIFYSIDGKQVAFTGLTHSATNWLWDFGDGNTSTEQNPVYIYENGGYYTATLTATDSDGQTAISEVNLAVALTPYVLLTSGPTASNGKTWKLTAAHPAEDRLANADESFSVASGAPETLPQGAFDLYLNMGEVYDDTYTFFFDGSYAHDVKSDGAAFSGLVFQYVTTGGEGIVNAGGADFGLCTGKYTPETDATFTYVESENFVVPSVYGADGTITFEDVSTLDFSGTEFVGFMDFQRKVILNKISDNSMQLVMFMAASPDHLPMNTHALVLTFVVVN